MRPADQRTFEPSHGRFGQRALRDRAFALAHVLLFGGAWLSYPGGMVLRFTAKVKKRAVMVRDVDLPDGSTVDVTIAAHDDEPEWDPTPEQWAEIREGERAADRGEGISIEECLARLTANSIRGHDYRTRTTSGAAGNKRVGAAPRARTKSAAKRARKRR
jgi:hypothetical protein